MKRILTGTILTVCMVFSSVLCVNASETYISGTIKTGDMIEPGSILKDLDTDGITTIRFAGIFDADDEFRVIEKSDEADDITSYETLFGEISESYGEVIINAELEEGKSYRWMMNDGEDGSFRDLSVSSAEICYSGITREDDGKILRCIVSLNVPESDPDGKEADYEDITLLDHTLSVLYMPKISGTVITCDGNIIYQEGENDA